MCMSGEKTENQNNNNNLPFKVIENFPSSLLLLLSFFLSFKAESLWNRKNTHKQQH